MLDGALTSGNLHGGWRGELGGSDRFTSVTADGAGAAALTLVLGEGLLPRAASVVGTQS